MPRSPHLALVLALASACGPATVAPEEREPGASSRNDIVGGAPTSDFSAAGAITRFGWPHCTGTLIDARQVLTAAHCLEGVTAASLKFVLGGSISAPESILSVASVHAHPEYDPKQLVNDIGYLLLATDAPVAPMAVISHLDAGWQGKPLVFVGYGKTGGASGGSGVKRSVSMPIKAIYPKTFLYQTPGKNTCNGDSGGPAFAELGGEWFVAGVTSYGDAGCTNYGVDTRADTFSEFLAGAQAPEPSAPAEPCHGETYTGRCDGNTVIWCENDSVKQLQCSSCGYHAAKGYYDCV